MSADVVPGAGVNEQPDSDARPDGGRRLYTLRESQAFPHAEHLEALALATPDMMFRLDNAGRIVEALPAVDEPFLIPPEQFMGQRFRDVMPPAIVALSEDALERAVASGQVVTFEFDLDLPDGRWTFEARLSATASGEAVVTVRDITRQRASETDLNTFFEMSPDLPVLADFDGRFTRLSESPWRETLGWSAAELLGRPYLDFVHPDDQEATMVAAGQLIEGHDVVGFENRYRTPTGDYRWLQWACRPIPESRTIVAIARDVTSAKSVQERESLLAEISTAAGLSGTGPSGLATAVTRVLTRLVPGTCWLEFGDHSTPPAARSSDVVSIHRVPVVANGVVVGALGVSLGEDEVLENRHKALLVEVAQRLAPLMENAQLHQRLIQTAEMVDATDTGIARLSAAGRVLSWNAGAERITGIRAAEAIGQHLPDLAGPRTALSARQLLATATERGEPVHREARHFRPDGSVVWVEVSIAPITGWSGQPDGVVVTVVDISDRKSAEARLEIVARTDNLTGLANRADLERSIRQALARCQDHDGGGALLLIDLDGFKEVNDRLGHRVGDGVLREVGARLSKSSLIGHLPGRFGGDQFGILLETTAQLGADHDLVVAGKILAALADPFRIGDHVIKLEASCGIALFPHDAVDGDELLWRADAAMYAAKRHGGGHAERFRPGMKPRTPDTEAEIPAVRAGMRAQEFVLYYQPVVSLPDGRIVAHEALARWQSPKGVLSPDAFLKVAENSGLIIPLGYQLMEMACAWLSATNGGDLWLNLSRRQFAAEDLPARLSNLLSAHSLASQRVTVEITETTLFDDPEQARATLAALRGMGIRVALDDFGTGYSSLGELRDLPVDSVKIDRSFVSGVDQPDADSQRAIVKAAIQMAHALELTVVAEGVESSGEETVVRDLGCDLAQGYYYGLPAPPDPFQAAEVAVQE